MRKKNNIIFTNGVFDLIHIGHIKLLKSVKNLGNKLIVGINSDKSVKRIKGTERPINNQKSRKLILESIRFVDKVVIFNEMNPSKVIRKIKPNIVVKGGDYTAKFIRNNDSIPKKINVKIIKLKKGYSSTNIIKKIKKWS